MWRECRTCPAQHLRSLALRLVDVRALPEEDFGRFHDALRQRRMRMDRELEIGRECSHFNREHTFGNQVASADAGKTDAENAFGARFDDELCQSIRTIER